MRVGFHVNYQKCDATMIALRAARHFRDMGYAVDILPCGRGVPVQPAWDQHALRSSLPRYQHWLKRRFAYVIWNEPPSREQLILANKSGAATLLLVSWDRLRHKDLPVCRIFDKVLCPSWLATTLLHDKHKLTNIVYIPWDAGVPFSVSSRLPADNCVQLFWPLWGSQVRRQEPAAFLPVLETMRNCPQTCLTVGTSGVLPRDFLRMLKNGSSQLTDRLSVLRADNFDKHVLAMGRHDLMLWPTLAESAGLVGLCSLSVGTPVLGFDYPLSAEFLRDGKNALLVPSEVRYNSLGVPHVDPDYAGFGRYLADAVANPCRLLAMRRTVLHGMRDRREQFVSAWDIVLRG